MVVTAPLVAHSTFNVTIGFDTSAHYTTLQLQQPQTYFTARMVAPLERGIFPCGQVNNCAELNDSRTDEKLDPQLIAENSRYGSLCSTTNVKKEARRALPSWLTGTTEPPEHDASPKDEANTCARSLRLIQMVTNKCLINATRHQPLKKKKKKRLDVRVGRRCIESNGLNTNWLNVIRTPARVTSNKYSTFFAETPSSDQWQFLQEQKNSAGIRGADAWSVPTNSSTSAQHSNFNSFSLGSFQ